MTARRWVPLFAVVSACAPADSLLPLADSERIRATLLAAPGSQTMTVHTSTTNVYSCGSALALRSGRNAALLFLDITGIAEGNDTCTPALAEAAPVVFSNITNQVMQFEIWNRGRVDRYTVFTRPGQDWTVTPQSGQFSTVSVRVP